MAKIIYLNCGPRQNMEKSFAPKTIKYYGRKTEEILQFIRNNEVIVRQPSCLLVIHSGQKRSQSIAHAFFNTFSRLTDDVHYSKCKLLSGQFGPASDFEEIWIELRKRQKAVGAELVIIIAHYNFEELFCQFLDQRYRTPADQQTDSQPIKFDRKQPATYQHYITVP